LLGKHGVAQTVARASGATHRKVTDADYVIDGGLIKTT